MLEATNAGETDGPGDGSVYGAFVSSLLEDQHSLKDSLERRAAGVITSSGVLVTLLFGLAAITTRTANYRLPHAAYVPLVIALIAFVAACGCALVVSVPFRYRGPTVRDLERIRLQKWRDRQWVARRRVAGTQIVVLRSYKRANHFKACWLIGAGVSQLVALAALGVAVGLILFNG